MKRLLLIALALVVMGCAPEYRISMCRHRAVECALVYGEVYGPERVGIAIGPTASPQWHGQAYVVNDKGHQWIINKGYGCEIGDREAFTPKEYYTVSGFMQNQFGKFVR